MTILAQLPVDPKVIPTADQMASWSATQFIQVGFGLMLVVIATVLVWFVRQIGLHSKMMNDHNDAMLKEMIARHEKQDERYVEQEVRHQQRDDKTNETMRQGFDKIADAIRQAGGKATR